MKEERCVSFRSGFDAPRERWRARRVDGKGRTSNERVGIRSGSQQTKNLSPSRSPEAHMRGEVSAIEERLTERGRGLEDLTSRRHGSGSSRSTTREDDTFLSKFEVREGKPVKKKNSRETGDEERRTARWSCKIPGRLTARSLRMSPGCRQGFRTTITLTSLRVTTP